MGEVVAVLRAADPDSGEYGTITYTLGLFKNASTKALFLTNTLSVKGGIWHQ
jgi:hypothetical protein